jgi:energy-converting hydrogenase Eha subunit G
MKLTRSEKWLLVTAFHILAVVIGILAYMDLISDYLAGFAIGFCIQMAFASCWAQRDRTAKLTESEKLLSGVCLLLAATAFILSAYAGLIAKDWIAGLIMATTTIAIQVLWPSKQGHPNEGGFPVGVDKK